MAMTIGTPVLGTYVAPATTSATATVTSPSSSDFYVALLILSSTTSAAPSISGVTGMTWTNVGDVVAGIGRCVAWVGTGGTATGTATASWGAQNRNGQLRIIPVTGVTALAVAVALAATGSSSLAVSATLDGPSQTPAVGDLVIEFGRDSSNGGLVAYAFTPSGWTDHGNTTNVDNIASAHKIAASTAAHKVTATNNHASARSLIMAQVVLRPTLPGAPHGAGTGAFAWAGSGTGHKAAHGAGTGAYAFTGVGTGHAHKRGAGSGAYAFAGSGTGHAPLVSEQHGSGTGAFAWAGTGTGHTVKHGVGSGTYGWVGTGTSHKSPHGSGAGSFGWVGVGSGTTPGAVPSGSGVGSFDWAGFGTGHNGEIHVDPWTDDLSGRTLLPLVTSGSFDFFPPLALPPEGMVERSLTRRSVIVPNLKDIPGAITDPTTGELRIPDHIYDALPLAAPVEDLGVLHVIVGGVDATYFRNKLALPLSDRSEEPFGDSTASLDLRALTSMDEDPDDPDHPLWWSINRANVEFVLQAPDGTLTRLWSGLIISDDTGNDQASVGRKDLIGSLWQAAHSVHQVPNMLEPTDIGSLIPSALNAVTSRRYPRMLNVTTGIESRARGSWSDSQLAYAQNLLATAWEDDGTQWTVAKQPGTRWSYEVRQKKTGSQWTVTNGARGVRVSLSRDLSQGRNVIYGRGVGPDGYAWRNTHYPNLQTDDAPLYPGSTMSLGSSGANVTLWQERVRDLGYTIAIDGTLGSGDIKTVKTIQRRYGLTVDGIIGAQTWAATFDVGANGGDLSGVVRLPLAADPRTQKWLYNAQGTRVAENPAYDSQHLVVEDDVDFGSGVTRAEGIASAQQIVDREMDPALTGTIELSTDPREGSRMLIPEGDRITLIGYKGADRVLHIVARERDWQGLTVRLTVDERARDAMTVAQIRQRDRESRRDPARRPGNVNRRSRLDVDQVVPFDGESGGGRVPKFALQPGLWSVRRIPFDEIGRVAKLDFRTSGPISKFCLAMFGSPIQPAHLIQYVGSNPLALDSPFEAHRETLEDDFGFIEAWGAKDNAAGYYPSQEGDGSLSGRLLDTGGFEFVSAKPPWVWVAAWSPNPTFLRGRILPATDQ